jgi:hypothetical protein
MNAYFAAGSAYNQHKAQALRPPFGGLFAWTHREAAQLFDSLFWAFGALGEDQNSGKRRQLKREAESSISCR